MKASLLALAVLLSLTTCSPAYGAIATTMKVLDGDTIRADVIVWPGISVATTLRLRRIDAPEITKSTPCEIEAGLKAKAYLEKLLAGASGNLEVVPYSYDSFGRVIAELKLQGVNIGDAMLTSGNAVPWTGKKLPWNCQS